MNTTQNRTLTFKLFLWIYALFYILAGINHFISAEAYYAIMPEWLPAHRFLICISGIIEIISGTLLLFSRTRRPASILIILMLTAFIPVHIYMIQMAPFMLGKFLVSPFIAWMRLPVQVLFALWAWYYYRISTNKF